MYSGKLSIPGKLSNELSYVFVEDDIEQQNGSITLFGIFDIKSGSELYHTIIKETVKHFLDFYHRSQMIDQEKFDDISNSAEFLFENSIQYTYEKITGTLQEAHEHAQRGQQFELRRINCILGAFIDDTLFLSVTGNSLVPFLMYPVPTPHGSSRYAMINILKQSGDAPSDLNARLFSNIISGKISIPACTVIICNQTFLDYIDPQHIKQIISNTPVASVIKNFHSILAKVNSRADFSALLFSNSVSGDQQYSRARSTLSSTSMQGLNGTEERTHSILAPTVHPYLKRYSNQFIASCLHLLRRMGLSIVTSIKSFFTQERRAHARASIQRLGASLLSGIKQTPRFFSFVLRMAKSAYSSIKNIDIRSFLHECKGGFRGTRELCVVGMRSAREKFLGLSAQSRSLLALSALFIFLFVVSLISIQIHKGAQQAGTKTREIIAGVEQKNDLIDASMLYDDRPRARALLSESRTLLDLVPQKFRTRADYRAAVQKIQDIDVRLNNIIHIAKPDVVASIAVDTTHTLPPLRAIAHGDTFLVYSTDTIYLLDSAKHTLNPLSNIQGKIPSISCAVSASPTLFYFCGGDGAHLYSLTLPDATVKTVSLPRDKNESSLDDVQMYNNRLYVLTKVTGTIYRHLTVSTGFSRGVAWTRQPNVMLKGARSFAIDGKVYTIGDDGSVYLFSAGTLQPRTTDATTNNALVNATHLWTDSDDPFLFALDASGKKMIAVNKKTFELSAQITSDQFSNLEGFTVNRPKKEILLLDANRIIRVPFDVK